MSDEYLVNFVIEKRQFSRELCYTIGHSLFKSHKTERTDKFAYGRHWSIEELNDPTQWLEKEIDTYFYSGRNGSGIGMPYLNAVGSVWKVFDRENDPIKSWYENIPKDKAIIVIGVEESDLRLRDYIKNENDDTDHESYVIKRVNNILKDAITVYTAIHPSIGITCLGSNTDTVTTIPTERRHIDWLNFFGPKLVKTFGREKLLSSPAYKIEKLPDEGILIMSGPAPYVTQKNRYFEKWDPFECQEKIARHLGLQDSGSK